MNTELRTEAKNDFEKDFLKYNFWKDNGKCEKVQRYSISNS